MLSSFRTQDTLQGTLSLFKSLGIKMNVFTEDSVDISNYLSDVPKTVSDIFPKIARCWFIGTIDDATLRGENEASDFESEVSGIDEHYKGMIVFAVDVAEGQTLTRTEISALTRAFNRRSMEAPVALILRSDDYLSFAICERTPWLRSDKTGEKPGKVLLLRNIYLPNPHRGHIDILQRMQVGKAETFDDLYAQWMQVFDSDVLTNQFYKELQNWFFWAIKNVSFPNDINDPTDDEKYNPENIIRLITRLVFVWFLLQKGLIPKDIFRPGYLNTILKDFDAESETSSQYYHTILQNLFFATLNRKIDERSFVDKKEYWLNRNQGKFEIKTFFRHADELLISKEDFIALLHGVPFINNSLFECLDGKESENKTYNWDGFSNSKKPQRQCCVPNKLFFAKEEIVDLSKEYERSTAKQTKVQGIINILNSFNFTVEENTPFDVDVALDPELLGKVFENLLALYNPETGKAVRKSTGSYYTPRPIVQYMVDESIVSYLKRKVPNISEETIRFLLSYNEISEIKLDDEQRRELVEAICNCRMLDPACGSGAFPMGILQQLSHLLSRIDKDNHYWKKTVMHRAMHDIKKTSHLKEAERESTKAEIEAVFSMSVNYPDYARKLYLIENCIYGVDIQTIAVQISRLRFFISLICEQQPTENSEDNYGIRPLPNLEMKFVAANTLVRLANADDAHLLFKTDEIEKLIDELHEVRHNLFIVTDNHKKTSFLKKDRLLREKIAELSADNFADERKAKIASLEKLLAEEEQQLQFAKDNLPETFETIQIKNLFGEVIEQRKENLRNRTLKDISQRINNIKADIKRLTETADSGRASTLALARQLTDWNPYDQNISSPFFDPEWMFGIKDGFDIVIGNPPYISVRTKSFDKKLKPYLAENFSLAVGQYDMYVLFIEKGHTLLNNHGILSYIIPTRLLSNENFQPAREYLECNLPISLFVDAEAPFESANVEANIMLCVKGYKTDFIKSFHFDKLNQSFHFNTIVDRKMICEMPFHIYPLVYSSPTLELFSKLQSIPSHPLSDYMEITRGFECGYSDYCITSDVTKYPLIKAEAIKPYILDKADSNILYCRPDFKDSTKYKSEDVFKTTPKLITKFCSNVINFAIDNVGYCNTNSVYNCKIPKTEFLNILLAILNSKITTFWFNVGFMNIDNLFPHIQKNQLSAIPIPDIAFKHKDKLNAMVNTITSSESNTTSNIVALINEIDHFVYHLYELTYDEVLLVDPQPPFTREEYDNNII